MACSMLRTSHGLNPGIILANCCLPKKQSISEVMFCGIQRTAASQTREIYSTRRNQIEGTEEGERVPKIFWNEFIGHVVFFKKSCHLRATCPKKQSMTRDSNSGPNTIVSLQNSQITSFALICFFLKLLISFVFMAFERNPRRNPFL